MLIVTGATTRLNEVKELAREL